MVWTASCSDSLRKSPTMQAMVSTRVGSHCASCLTVIQCTSTTGAYIARMTASVCGALGLVAALVGGQHVLGSRDAAEGVGVLLLGRAAQEDRRVARVGHGVVHVVARVEQVRVGGGRVEGEDHGAGGELRDDLRGDRLERDVRHGEDDDVGVLDGVGQLGHLAAGLDGALLAGGGVLDVADVVRALGEVVGDAHPHLAAGADDGDGEVLGHGCGSPSWDGSAVGEARGMRGYAGVRRRCGARRPCGAGSRGCAGSSRPRGGRWSRCRPARPASAR